MKTGKTILLGLIVALVVGHSAFAESTENAQQSNERGIVGKIIDGLVESTQEAHAVQKQLTAEQHQAFLERHANAVEPNAELAKVKEAKGLKAKFAQIMENLAEGLRTASEKEQARREEHNRQMASVNPHIRARQNIQGNNTSE